jgi:glycine/D-amino acid oxidase-like deaminating enzyme
MPPRDADAVVIGAGAFGSSIAYHLARLGWRNTVLLDRHDLASQTSPRAAGLSGRLRGSDLMTTLASRSVEKIRSFAAETGEALVSTQPGSLKIARTPDHEAQLRRDVERGRRLGVEVSLISPAEVHRLAPFVEPAGIRAATYIAGDIYLEPVHLPLASLRAAARLGVTLLPFTPATGIDVVDGAVSEVRVQRQGAPADIESESIRTPVVVDAAGAWARLVGDFAERTVSIVPTRHQLAITQPVAGVTPDLPIVRIVDANVYVRPENGGFLMGGYEADPLQVDVRRKPAGFSIDELQLDLDVLRGLAGLVSTQLPILGPLLADPANLRQHRGGLPTMTADGQHLVGPVAGVRGLWVATGCCVGGLTISPAIGEVLAEWIVSGAAPMDLTALSPDRFASQRLSDAQLAAAAQERYAHHYWPGESGTSGLKAKSD